MNLRKDGGFTLIELMIVVVIIGIITTIAVQSFSGANQDGERACIISELGSLNDAMARFYQGNYSYAGSASGDDTVVEGVRGTVKACKSYDVTVALPTAQSYFIEATPKAGGIMDETGVYSVGSNGTRCHFPGNDGANPAVDGCPKTW